MQCQTLSGPTLRSPAPKIRHSSYPSFKKHPHRGAILLYSRNTLMVHISKKTWVVHISKINTLTMHFGHVCAEKCVFPGKKRKVHKCVYSGTKGAKWWRSRSLLACSGRRKACTGEKVQHHVPSAVTCAIFENVVEICWFHIYVKLSETLALNRFNLVTLHLKTGLIVLLQTDKTGYSSWN